MSQTLEPIFPTLILPNEMAARRKRWTRDECRALVAEGCLKAGKFELIEGEIIHKMGQNEPPVFACSAVFDALRGVFGLDHVRQAAPILIDTVNEPEPDAAVTVRPRRDYLALGTPPARYSALART